MKNSYDIVTCISNNHLEIGIRAIRSLIELSEAKRIFIITPKKNINFFKQNFPKENSLIILDEDKIIPNIKLTDVANTLREYGGKAERAGWYFQQFLKMNISRYPNLSEYYLIWDSDTVMLKKIKFFDESNKLIINTSKEFHKPYFQTIKNFGLLKTNNFSFISEHMLINSKIMNDLISLIEKANSKNLSWVKTVISQINKEHLNETGSGFSEFETYGTYLSKYHPNSFVTNKLKSCRNTYSLFGKHNQINTFLILRFYGYYWASFENWDLKTQNFKNLRLIRIFNNLVANFLIIFINITNSYKHNFEFSRYLAMPLLK
ncbi:Hypothetical protein P9515_17061 [Prochlorococcus marinus str. MIT 9515]|uniref:Glycosyl transferase family 8 n=1 Tax=Prochlorococcus marinus (strain MIT 9515) TaxID=167542 RepID=A2BYQ2_PROM5|nr:DUF6492 family protein [Prochlorococcus marinus]ABM72913.1 Hypothetical protein P9515_17061 [Prochlorococcus marinus str. MIT 9515]